LTRYGRERNSIGLIPRRINRHPGWVLLLSRDLEIDLPAAFASKMRQNAVKYPVEKAKGVAKKYTEL